MSRDTPVPEIQENEQVQVPPIDCPLAEQEYYQELSALCPLQRSLASSYHAVDVYQEVLDFFLFHMNDIQHLIRIKFDNLCTSCFVPLDLLLIFCS